MLTHEHSGALRAELRELQSKSSYTVDDLTRIDEIGEAIATAISDRSRRTTIDDLGAPPDLGTAAFADAIRSAGFTGPRGTNTVEVEFKAASFDGDPLDFSPRRFGGGAPLAYDQRWLHPVCSRRSTWTRGRRASSPSASPLGRLPIPT
jgi:hypothetical protein